MQESIQKGVLLSAGVRHESQVRVVSEGDIAWFSDQRHHQVAAVGQKIISAAREMVNEQLEAAMRVVADQLPPDATEADLLRACGTDPTVQLWYHARLHLQGENSQTTTPWKYIFIDSEVPNAFVTEVLPQRFFITTGMVRLLVCAGVCFCSCVHFASLLLAEKLIIHYYLISCSLCFIFCVTYVYVSYINVYIFIAPHCRNTR